jgi:hypothetical protein
VAFSIVPAQNGCMSSANHLLISERALQQTVGWIAFLMPVTVRLLAFLSPEQIWTTNSISAYYYSSARDVFVGALVVGGVVMAFFDTGQRRDRWISVLAGAAAIGIALFPMKISVGVLRSPGTILPDDESKLVDALLHAPHGPLGYHFIFVAAFFVLTFYLVAFRFRANTPALPTQEKCMRNKVYIVCSAIMAVAFVWIAVLELNDQQQSIFWPETLAVMAFSAAWLVKGQLVLKDGLQASPSVRSEGLQAPVGRD